MPRTKIIIKIWLPNRVNASAVGHVALQIFPNHESQNYTYISFYPAEEVNKRTSLKEVKGTFISSPEDDERMQHDDPPIEIVLYDLNAEGMIKKFNQLKSNQIPWHLLPYVWSLFSSQPQQNCSSLVVVLLKEGEIDRYIFPSYWDYYLISHALPIIGIPTSVALLNFLLTLAASKILTPSNYLLFAIPLSIAGNSTVGGVYLAKKSFVLDNNATVYLSSAGAFTGSLLGMAFSYAAPLFLAIFLKLISGSISGAFKKIRETPEKLSKEQLRIATRIVNDPNINEAEHQAVNNLSISEAVNKITLAFSVQIFMNIIKSGAYTGGLFSLFSAFSTFSTRTLLLRTVITPKNVHQLAITAQEAQKSFLALTDRAPTQPTFSNRFSFFVNSSPVLRKINSFRSIKNYEALSAAAIAMSAFGLFLYYRRTRSSGLLPELALKGKSWELSARL